MTTDEMVYPSVQNKVISILQWCREYVSVE